jgi:hypothetical protein
MQIIPAIFYDWVIRERFGKVYGAKQRSLIFSRNIFKKENGAGLARGFGG